MGTVYFLQVIPTFVSWLPVWDDADEVPHVYGYFADLVERYCHFYWFTEIPTLDFLLSGVLHNSLHPSLSADLCWTCSTPFLNFRILGQEGWSQKAATFAKKKLPLQGTKNDYFFEIFITWRILLGS